MDPEGDGGRFDYHFEETIPEMYDISETWSVTVSHTSTIYEH